MAKTRERGITHIKGNVWLIDTQINGKRCQIRIHASSLTQVRADREKRRVELREEATKTPVNGQERSSATFDEAWVKLEADLLTDNVSLKSRQRYKRVYHVLFNEFRPAKFPEITSPSQLGLPFLLEYKNYFVVELKRDPNGGWKAEVICIKSMMRRLKRLGFCEKKFIEELDEIRRPNSLKKSYPDISNEQLKKMFEFIKKDRPQYYFLFMFMLITGRRIGETTEIEKNDIGWDGGTPMRINIRPQTTKTKHRETPITRLNEELRQLIMKASRRNPSSEHVFSGSEADQCKPDRLREYLARISKNVLETRLTPHYFRHRFMTTCGQMRVPFADVSDVSGIKDIKVMQKYYTHATTSGHDSVFAATAL